VAVMGLLGAVVVALGVFVVAGENLFLRIPLP
jgi:hypothetical protein